MYTIVVKTLAGLETVLSEELNTLGLHQVKEGRRMVMCEGELSDVYRINYLSRLALKVLVKLDERPVRHADDVYKLGKKINWSDWFDNGRTFAVDSVSFNRLFTHTGYPALLTKDAIVDHFREKNGKRPSVDVRQPDVRIHIHVSEHKATLYLDSSGDSLHLRGYKSRSGVAPLSEVLAAGLISLTGWDGSKLLHDPMCGSGTILTEALMMRCHIPAQMFRKFFCFEKWQNFDREAFNDIKEEARKKIQLQIPLNISGADIAGRNIRDTENNLSKLPHGSLVELAREDFMDSESEDESITILTNPPYDERLSLHDVHDFYSHIGDTLKHGYTNCEAFIFSPKNMAKKHLGLKPAGRTTMYNGKIECELINYQLF